MSLPTLQQVCARQGQRVAFRHADQTLSYAELTATVKPYAAALSAQGVRPGMRVALLCTSTPDCVFAVHALIWLGATLQPLSARQPLASLRAQLQRLGSEVLLDPTQSLPTAVDVSLPAMLKWQPSAAPAPACVRLQPAHVLTVMLTSGSTAAARPVPLTVANHLASARAVAERLQHNAEDCWLLCLPLHHIGGLAIVLRSLIVAGSLYLCGRIDARQLRRLLAAEPVISLASMVPTMLQRLLAVAPDSVASGLRALLIGGAPATAELLQQARAAALPVLPTYGMTEACSQLATLAPKQAAGVDFLQHRGLAGTALDGVELRVTDAGGKPMPLGQTGRIMVRGEMISRDMLRQQPEVAVWRQQGWLLTDDYGRITADGMLYVSHRHSDVIISGGENILRTEVEQALWQTGLLDDVAVTAVADAEWGQLVAALVVPQAAGQSSSKQAQQSLIGALLADLRQRLDPVKLPRRWCVLTALPRNENGKLQLLECQRLAAAADTFTSRRVKES